MIKSRICCVCNQKDGRYKCPTCRHPYCSKECWKDHKEKGCKLEETEQTKTEIRKVYEFPTEDTVPLEKLEQLRHSEELKQCLRNPHVRDMMTALLNDPNPTEAIAMAMREPIFVEMADACLKVVEPPDEDKPC